MRNVRFVLACALLLALAACGGSRELPAPPTTITEVFGRIDCASHEAGMRFCEGAVETRVSSFDGVPLDVNVAFPADTSAAEAPYPLVVRLHGYTGTKEGPYLGGAQGPSVYTQYTNEGFAVMTFTARGRGASCGTEASREAAPEACAEGWDQLGDTRTSIRDVQHLAGRLADAGLVRPAIGVQGGSYGGGRSLTLATLRDRIRRPDGSYASWKSPEREIEMEVAAAVPFIAWSDLTYALAPNGRALDYALGPDSLARAPLGPYKESLVRALWSRGKDHYNAPPGADPSIDLETWIGAFPTSAAPTAASRRAAREYTETQSALSVPMTHQPAPTLVANGFTDDLFPVGEAVRWVNHVRAKFPDTEIAQLYGDFGHRRADQSSAPLLAPRALDWFQHYLQGAESAPVPAGEVLAFVQACGGGFGERHRADSWRALSKGEVRFTTRSGAVVRSDTEDAAVSRMIDPPSGRSDRVPSGSCRTVGSTPAPGTAVYTLPPVGVEGGYTLLGASTVIAELDVRAEERALLVARLWDVDPEAETRTLVTQGLYRPDSGASNDGNSAQAVFQLNANAYPFAAGHRVELQLLGRSTPYVEPPSVPFSVTVEALDLRLPVAEAPDAAAGVEAPAPKVLPEGWRWAPGYGVREE